MTRSVAAHLVRRPREGIVGVPHSIGDIYPLYIYRHICLFSLHLFIADKLLHPLCEDCSRCVQLGVVFVSATRLSPAAVTSEYVFIIVLYNRALNLVYERKSLPRVVER